jgi:hypothetical protein
LRNSAKKPTQAQVPTVVERWQHGNLGKLPTNTNKTHTTEKQIKVKRGIDIFAFYYKEIKN